MIIIYSPHLFSFEEFLFSKSNNIFVDILNPSEKLNWQKRKIHGNLWFRKMKKKFEMKSSENNSSKSKPIFTSNGVLMKYKWNNLSLKIFSVLVIIFIKLISDLQIMVIWFGFFLPDTFTLIALKWYRSLVSQLSKINVDNQGWNFNQEIDRLKKIFYRNTYPEEEKEGFFVFFLRLKFESNDLIFRTNDQRNKKWQKERKERKVFGSLSFFLSPSLFLSLSFFLSFFLTFFLSFFLSEDWCTVTTWKK